MSKTICRWGELEEPALKRRQFKMPAMSAMPANGGPTPPSVAGSSVSFPGPRECAPAHRSCAIQDSYATPKGYQEDCTHAVEEELSLRCASSIYPGSLVCECVQPCQK